MQCAAALRKPLSLSIHPLRQPYNPFHSNSMGRSLTTHRYQFSWRLKLIPSSCAQLARRTISDQQAPNERKGASRLEFSGKDGQIFRSDIHTYNKLRKVSHAFAYIAFMTAIGLGMASIFIINNDTSSASKPWEFIPFTIVSKETISSNSAIFTLRPLASFPHEWHKGVWSVEFKQPELQIARAYTPLPPFHREGTENENEELKFLIRKEYKGEVSNYLHRLPLGAIVELRGPKYEWEVPEEDEIKDVIFIAGGTGIAPALQIVRTIFDNSRKPTQSPKMHILWANRRREDLEGIKFTKHVGSTLTQGWFRCWWWADSSNYSTLNNNIDIQYPLSPAEGAILRYPKTLYILGVPVWETMVQEEPSLLEPVAGSSTILSFLSLLHSKYPFDFSLDCKIDEENTFIQAKELQKLVDRRDSVRGAGRQIIVVCGPDGFVDVVSGPKKIFKDGKEVENKEVEGILGNGGLGERIKKGKWEIVRL